MLTQLNLLKSESGEDRYMEEIKADVAQQIRSVHILHVQNVLIDLVKS